MKKENNVDQVERYVELRLCMCSCDDHGLTEGSLQNLNLDNRYLAERYGRALNIVIETLQHRQYSGLHVGMGYIVHSLEESDAIIVFAEANIENTHGVIELSHSCHGQLMFLRKIRFVNRTKEDLAALAKIFMEAGYRSCGVDPEKDAIYKEYKRLLSPEEYEEKLKELKWRNQQLWEEFFDTYENGKKTSIRWR